MQTLFRLIVTRHMHTELRLILADQRINKNGKKMISKSKDNGGNVWISVLSRHWHCTYLLFCFLTLLLSAGRRGNLTMSSWRKC